MLEETIVSLTWEPFFLLSQEFLACVSPVYKVHAFLMQKEQAHKYEMYFYWVETYIHTVKVVCAC